MQALSDVNNLQPETDLSEFKSPSFQLILRLLDAPINLRLIRIGKKRKLGVGKRPSYKKHKFQEFELLLPALFPFDEGKTLQMTSWK